MSFLVAGVCVGSGGEDMLFFHDGQLEGVFYSSDMTVAGAGVNASAGLNLMLSECLKCFRLPWLGKAEAGAVLVTA
jgi:hypothetical protein